MNSLPQILFGLGAGTLLGIFFYGGLWLTVRAGLASAQPVFWFTGSLLIRTAIVTLGFYFMLGNDAVNLMTGLLGFTAARLISIRISKRIKRPEDRHAA